MMMMMMMMMTLEEDLGQKKLNEPRKAEHASMAIHSNLLQALKQVTNDRSGFPAERALNFCVRGTPTAGAKNG